MTTIPTRQFTGRHMLIIMLCFFAVVLAANVTMVFYARHSWTGLVVRNAYVASQEFNANTQAMVKAAEIDVKIELDKTTIRVFLHDSSGRAVSARAVVLRVGRPSHEGEDTSLMLAARGAGLFEGQHTLSGGQWSGAVTAQIPGIANWSRPIYLLVEN